jgi:hypothetical protein
LHKHKAASVVRVVRYVVIFNNDSTTEPNAQWRMANGVWRASVSSELDLALGATQGHSTYYEAFKTSQYRRFLPV